MILINERVNDLERVEQLRQVVTLLREVLNTISSKKFGICQGISSQIHNKHPQFILGLNWKVLQNVHEFNHKVLLLRKFASWENIDIILL